MVTQLELQLTEELTQADRDDLLCSVCFPSGSGVDDTIVAFVLHRIASFSNSEHGCYESEERLAAMAKVKPKQVNRAMTLLRKLDLVASGKVWHPGYRKTLVHRRVAWESLRRLVAHQASSSLANSSPTDRTQPGDRPDVLSRPTGRSQATDRTFQADRPDAQTSANRRELKQPPPIQPEAGAGSELLHSQLRAVGLSCVAKAVALVESAGLSSSDVAAILDEYRRHSRLLKSPGSILHRLENGTWPVELPEARRAAEPTQSQMNQRRESIRCEIARGWKASGRWLSATEAEINAEIDRRLNLCPT